MSLILLMDLSADFREALEEIIASNGGRTVSLSTHDILTSKIFIDCRGGIGKIQLSNGHQISLEDICGSIASPACLESSEAGPDELEFMYSEAVGLLAYLREQIKFTLNPPFAGSHVTNCGSLLEQWERVKRANIGGIIVPEWTVQSLGNLRSDRLEIADPFDLPLRLMSDDSGQGELRISATKPRGAFASCAFHRETLHLLILKNGKWCEAQVPDRTASRLRSVIEMFKNSCGIDFGQIHFSYFSDVLFWSIMPNISDEHVRSPGCRTVLAKIAGSLT